MAATSSGSAKGTTCVDRRDGKAGDEVVFSKVLLIAGGDAGPTIGAPVVEGARVVGTIVDQFRTKKIIIQKFRRRKNVRRRRGHRQSYTTVRITSRLPPLTLLSQIAQFTESLDRRSMPKKPPAGRFFVSNQWPTLTMMELG